MSRLTTESVADARRRAFERVALAAAMWVVATAASAAAERPTLPLYTAAQIPVVCDKGLANVRKSLADLESMPLKRASVKTVFSAINRMQIAVEDVEGPIYLLSNVHPDKAIRDAAEACLLKFNEFDTDLLQSEPLYRRVLAVNATTAVERKLKKDLVEGFEDTGVALPGPKRARMKVIIQKLEEARQEIGRASCRERVSLGV